MPFPAAAFFGAMLDDKLDVDAGSRTSLNSGAPYLARQMSWCENQGTGGSYLLGSFDIGACEFSCRGRRQELTVN